MPSSLVEMANLALNRLGDQAIVTLTEDTDAARTMNLIMIPTLDAKIRGHFWNWSQQRATLGQVAVGPLWSSSSENGFDYQFQLPQDPFCLRVVATSLDADEPYRIESYQTATSSYRVLLCNQSAVSILYQARITDVTLWDGLFADAMAAELAFQACYAITRNGELKRVIYEEAKEAWRIAKSVDGQESRTMKSITSYVLTRGR